MASPAEFIVLQERVDIPRLEERLEDSRAVREDAAALLHRKRASFLVTATECYGLQPGLIAEGMKVIEAGLAQVVGDRLTVNGRTYGSSVS